MTDYTELIRSLKACEHDECYPERCDWFGKYQVDLRCKNILLANAAAAIEELLPKRGEWIYEDLDNFRKYKVTCPHCGKWFVGNYDAYDEPSDFLYCPHCGNICNPTNLDWENELKEREKESRAKMEVQE